MKIFEIEKPIIGMIHVEALPGTPNYRGDFSHVIKKAIEEALLYKENGIDIIAIENMHDVPYLNRKVGAEISTSMSIIGYEVKNKTGLACGMQILAGANKQAIAAANAGGLDFIRAEGFVFAHVADEGIIDSDAGELLRYRKKIGADKIKIFTDIKKKHSSHSITADTSIAEVAEAAEFFLSDGVIVTGTSTGKEADINEINEVKRNVKIPVLIGSGITIDNISDYLPLADAFIVGSYFKCNGDWKNSIDPKKVQQFMEKVNKLR